MRHSLKFLFISILLLILLSGCSLLVTADQVTWPETVELASGKTVGQTFQARYDGMASVAVFLIPGRPGDGRLLFHLRHYSAEATDLAVLSVPLDGVNSAQFYKLDIPPIPQSARQDYYIFLAVEGEGSVQVGSASPDAYPAGSAYQDHQPITGQLAFRLGYDPLQAAAGLAREALVWLSYLAAAFLLFVIPGWALLSWFWSGWEPLRWPERLGIAICASLAIYPLIFLWTGLVGLHLGALYAWLPPALGLIAILGKPRNAGRVATGPLHSGLLTGWLRSPDFLPDLAFVVLSGLVFIVRFWGVRLLNAPMWGDSYQHSLIAQLLVDNGGIFQSWQPYAEMQSFTYHFGLHSLLAVFYWVVGQPVMVGTIWAGQILNGLAAICLYPLATRLGRSPWAGVAAVLIAGLLAPMPMYYVNWGRYTQLAGQVILPAVILVVWKLVEDKDTPADRKRSSWADLGLAAILLAGLALTHYRIFLFGLTFFAAVLLFNWRRGIVTLIRLAWIGLGAGVLFLPWMMRVFGGEIYHWLTSRVTLPASQLSEFSQQSNAAGNLATYLPAWLWLLLIVAFALALWQRETGAALVGVWWFLTYLAANPQWVGLPGAGVITSFTVLIAAYIPAAVLIGATAGWLDEAVRCRAVQPGVNSLVGWRYERPRRDLSKLLALAFLVAFSALGIEGSTARLADVQIETHALVTHADLRAAKWIQANTPPKSRFLVNSFFAYNNSAVVGSDAGWWLPLTANRPTTLPPLNYTVEAGPRPDYIQWVNELPATILTAGTNNPETLRALADRGVSYVYIGQKNGGVNNPGTSLDPQELLASPYYRLVYHQDQVWIFQLQFTQ